MQTATYNSDRKQYTARSRTTGNRVYVEDGEVKTEVVTESMSIEEAKKLTLEAIELEYSLP